MQKVQSVLFQAYRFAVPDIDTETARNAVGHLLHHDLRVVDSKDAIIKLDAAAEKCLAENYYNRSESHVCNLKIMSRVFLYWYLYRRSGQLIEYLPIDRCLDLYNKYPNQARYMAKDPLTYPMLTLEEASLIVPEAPAIEVELAADIRNMVRNLDSVYDPPVYQPLDKSLQDRFRISQANDGAIYLKV